jgi:DNA repair photolyase
LEKHLGLVKEKGRKSNYHQLNLETGEMTLHQRLLNKEEINSFLEVSLRAAHCPMPLNCDVWDGLKCGFGCRYCFADSFRASLYTSFFDNSKSLGLRHCNPDFFRSEMDKLMKYRDTRNEGNELQRAIGMQIPIRLGIRFEDFLPIEGKRGISLNFLKYMKEQAYPVMINTKSSLIGREDYVRELADNEGRSAVHITMISSDDRLNKKLEPGAPPFMERIGAAKALTDAGIRVVGRIEPLIVFVNDEKEWVDEWIKAVKGAGIRNVTLDTYSWSATAPGIQRQMEMEGLDFEREFLIMSDAQWLGSLMLSKFVEYLRGFGLTCSTFDFGNVPTNDQDICCEVGDWFSETGGFSYGNNLIAIRFVKSRKGKYTTWDQFDSYVEEKGGWLSDALRFQVYQSWNQIGNGAYFLYWAPGIEKYGMDKDGNRVWIYNDDGDFREEWLKVLA